MSALVSSIFVALMLLVLIHDVAWRRIPNRLTVAVMLLGICAQLPGGVGAVGAGLAGVALGFLIGIPLFALGAVGGGDVKLMAAVGAFLGPRDLVWALLLAGSLGLLLALGEITRRKVMVPVLYRSRDLVLHLVTLGRRGERPTLDGPGAVTVPYGVAIATGAVCAWFYPMAEVLG